MYADNAVEPNFRVERTVSGESSVLTLYGELDVASSALLEAELDQLSDSDRAVVDLRSLEFIDSTGLGLLFRSHQRLQQADGEGSLIIVSGDGQVKRLIAMTGLDEQLHLVEALDEALAAE